MIAGTHCTSTAAANPTGGNSGDLERKTMADRETGLWVHFRNEEFFFFATAIYISVSQLLKTVFQATLKPEVLKLWVMTSLGG